MTFASVTFIIFFLLTVLCCVIVQKTVKDEQKRMKLKHIFLLMVSYVFYGWWNWKFCFLLLGVSVIAFCTATKKEEITDGKMKFRYAMGVISPLVVLGVFKYYNFFIQSFSDLFGIRDVKTLSIILPVGISFYTFQALSYSIDVYYGKIEKEKSFLKFALYISFFPQLVAGPIVKASEFLPQLNEDGKVSLKGVEYGVQIFLFGMFKKIVLADNLSVFVDEVYRTPNAYSAFTVFLAVVSYAIQIYMDFSGYSDMAIGCASCLGYSLTRNFNLPYISQNVSEFWKRWHISLSTWLQQYLYIPLGGNRKGQLRTYINNLLTMILGGLWHGASWTFVAWGTMHGIALCVHKMFKKLVGQREISNRILKEVICIFNVILTNIFVGFCWIFFRASDFNNAKNVILQIVCFRNGITHIYTWSIVAICFLAVSTLLAILKGRDEHRKYNGFYPVFSLSKFGGLLYIWVELLLILGLAYVKSSPFIYFQF